MSLGTIESEAGPGLGLGLGLGLRLGMYDALRSYLQSLVGSF